MKLILKQVAPQIDVTALGDAAKCYTPGKPDQGALFALHTEDGQMLPCQVSTSLNSHARDGLPSLIVTFNVDGCDLVVEGHGFE